MRVRSSASELMGCCKSRTMANKLQPGAIDSIKAESFHGQRTSTKDLDINEEDDDGEVDDGEVDDSLEDSLIDDAQERDGEEVDDSLEDSLIDDAQERDGEDIILHRQESGETDKRVAVSAKPDTSSARTQVGDGEGIDEVRQ
eukprot:1035974_1